MAPLFDIFKARAEAVSAEVHRCANRSEALDFIIGLLRAEKVADAAQSWAVWANGSILDGVDRQELARQVPGLTFDVTRERADGAKVGISQAEWAISATGTLVMDAMAVETRLASSLPVIHLAVVPTDGIQPDMAAVFTRLHPGHSNYISMITGPSRTADIERVLTIGVHGPARLVILFVDEMERN
jgi:L-lactate dehydrogenase complex protein LldG